MREILFRGKVIDEVDRWVEGYLVVAGGMASIFSQQGIFVVDPDAVGQFTGLVDKRGKRIFEGDIVTYCWYEVETMNFCVDFVSGDFLAVPIKKLDDVWAIRISGTNKKMEVIGNIHDNHELLEVNEDG